MKSLLGIFLFFLYSETALANCTMKVRVVEFPPFYTLDPEAGWQGLALDIIRPLLAEIGCQPIYQNVPWSRALHQLEQGSLDVMISLSKTAERAQFLHFIGPVLEERMVLTANFPSSVALIDYKDYKQLAKPIGLLRGAFYGEAFARAIAQDPALAAKFIFANSSADNRNNLRNYRISGYVTEEFSAYYYLARLGEGYYIHPSIFHQSRVYLGVSKKSLNEQQAQLLQRAFQRLTDDGVIAHIVSKYKQVK